MASMVGILMIHDECPGVGFISYYMYFNTLY